MLLCGSVVNCVVLGVLVGFQQVNLQILVIIGGNFVFDLEILCSFSVGFVWSLWFGSNVLWFECFDVEVMFYCYIIEGVIQVINVQIQFDLCVDILDLLYCDGIICVFIGVVSGFNNCFINLGLIKIDGWDVDLFWMLLQSDIGQFKLVWKNIFVGCYEVLGVVGQWQLQELGVEVVDSFIFEWISNVSLFWLLGCWNVLWMVCYIFKLIEECGDVLVFLVCSNQVVGINELVVIIYYDLQLGYKVDWLKGLQLSVGLNNVFDKDLLICLFCLFNGYDVFIYDILCGCYWYLCVDLWF